MCLFDFIAQIAGKAKTLIISLLSCLEGIQDVPTEALEVEKPEN